MDYNYTQHSELAQRYRSGVNWFYWIAGLTIITSLIATFGGGVTMIETARSRSRWLICSGPVRYSIFASAASSLNPPSGVAIGSVAKCCVRLANCSSPTIDKSILSPCRLRRCSSS